MFSVIYTFEVKPGAENDFVKAWSALTQLFKEYAGSGGSRLNKAATGNYVAYAQWPDRQTWEQAAEKLPLEAGQIRKKMRESCLNIDTQFELESIVDLIQNKQ